MKKLLKYFFYLLIAVCVYYSGMYFLAWKNGNIGNSHITGISMYPTLKSNDMIFINKFERPVIGDIISFECLVDKCMHESVAHRLVSIESNGCMHIEGDNQPIATDTIDYGCLMPDEIHIDGVVHKLSF